MLKAFVITFLLGYLLYKVLGLFGIITKSAQQGYGQASYQSKSSAQPPRRDGDINIDYVPKDGKSNNPVDNFKGGEYVDYEEIE